MWSRGPSHYMTCTVSRRYGGEDLCDLPVRVEYVPSVAAVVVAVVGPRAPIASL